MSIHESTYYRRQHVTGPGCVFVSIKFGKTPDEGVLVVKRIARGKDEAQLQFDLERHIKEIIEGVDEANLKLNGCLQVQEIEVAPDDYPQKGQAKHAAFQIAGYVLDQAI